MKKVFLTIFTISITCITATAQWTKIPAGTGLQLNKVFFSSKDVGYIVPYRGNILRTLDGGNSWESLSSMETSSGSFATADNSIFFLNDNIGFISTLEQGMPKVYKTSDMGSTDTWEDVTPDSQLYSVPKVQFLNENTGYLFSNNGWDGQLYKTIDGGKTWADLNIGINIGSGTGNMPSMFFTDENTGYITGGDGTFEYRGIIARTTDGGKSWSITKLPQYSTLNSIHFPNKDTGYVTSGVWNKAIVFRTINGGQTWDSLTALETGYNNKVFFTDGKTGFVLSASTIHKTTDAGASWTPQDPGTTLPMQDIFFTDKNNGFIVGDSGLVLKTTNGGASGFKQEFSVKRPSVFPNPSKGIFDFRIDDPEAESIEIFDGLGNMVLSEKAKSIMQIDLSTQSAGVYYYRIIGKNMNTGKLIRN